ncbi:MAG: glucose-6-phosphate dehydrogenase [Candidatus Taylorbacteria bacterium]|nr:glucose-6-phosphate dehydrogenase [Candidatus Taylorbacteria bacterium]
MQHSQTQNSAPTIFVIFGITGDLAGRKLLPALLNLYVKKVLPQKFAIVGFSRRNFTREEFRQYIRDNINIKPGQFKEEDVKHFLDHMSYEQGLFDTPESYHRLAEKLQSIDESFKQCSNKLFHLSVPPTLYEGILENLSSSGLTIPCGGDLGWTRVLIEKPFGNDIETAKKLDKRIGDLFSEEQIFRIDHYLAKEALQNVLAFRFANTLFEPLWNRHHVDKVHIKLLEKIDIEDRGEFYDKVGALKDVGQNHVLQMLALVAMESPEEFDAEHIRKERAKVLKHLMPITSKNINDLAVRGQYEGYLHEKGVRPESQTETYFRLETYIENARWKDVPFFLESGKALSESKAEIDIYFKNENEEERQNILTFRIQPDEGIKIRFWVKTPGFGLQVEPKTLKFKYSDFDSLSTLPDAYEKVLFDAFVGDQTLFTSTDEVVHAWKFISPIVELWNHVPMTRYKKGSSYVY